MSSGFPDFEYRKIVIRNNRIILLLQVSGYYMLFEFITNYSRWLSSSVNFLDLNHVLEMIKLTLCYSTWYASSYIFIA